MRYINYAENNFSPLLEDIWNWYVNPVEFAAFFSVLFVTSFPQDLSHLNKRPVTINSNIQL